MLGVLELQRIVSRTHARMSMVRRSAACGHSADDQREAEHGRDEQDLQEGSIAIAVVWQIEEEGNDDVMTTPGIQCGKFIPNGIIRDEGICALRAGHDGPCLADRQDEPVPLVGPTFDGAIDWTGIAYNPYLGRIAAALEAIADAATVLANRSMMGSSTEEGTPAGRVRERYSKKAQARMSAEIEQMIRRHSDTLVKIASQVMDEGRSLSEWAVVWNHPTRETHDGESSRTAAHFKYELGDDGFAVTAPESAVLTLLRTEGCDEAAEEFVNDRAGDLYLRVVVLMSDKTVVVASVVVISKPVDTWQTKGGSA